MTTDRALSDRAAVELHFDQIARDSTPSARCKFITSTS